jgi:hypothetical protein
MTLHANGRRLIATVSVIAAITAVFAVPTAAFARTKSGSLTPASDSSVTTTTPAYSAGGLTTNDGATHFGVDGQTLAGDPGSAGV